MSKNGVTVILVDKSQPQPHRRARCFVTGSDQILPQPINTDRSGWDLIINISKILLNLLNVNLVSWSFSSGQSMHGPCTVHATTKEHSMHGPCNNKRTLHARSLHNEHLMHGPCTVSPCTLPAPSLYGLCTVPSRSLHGQSLR